MSLYGSAIHTLHHKENKKYSKKRKILSFITISLALQRQLINAICRNQIGFLFSLRLWVQVYRAPGASRLEWLNESNSEVVMLDHN